MNAELKAEVQAWIADDPDPKTAAELTALLESNDEQKIHHDIYNGIRKIQKFVQH